MKKLIAVFLFIATTALGQHPDDLKYSIDYMIDARKKNRDKVVLTAAEGTNKVIGEIRQKYVGEAQQEELVYFYKAVYDYKVVDKSILNHMIDSLILNGLTKQIRSEAKVGKDFVTYRTLSTKMRDFVYPDKNGNPIELSSLNNKIVIVELWASWCAPCVKEMPIIPEVRSANPNIEFYSISFDYKPDEMKKFLEKKKYEWPVVFAGYANKDLFDYLHIVAIPKYYTLDRNGIVINVADHLDKEYLLSLK